VRSLSSVSDDDDGECDRKTTIDCLASTPFFHACL
jgi:hypothetical protein